VGIVGLDPMSIVNLSIWHVNIASGTFTFLVLLLVWHGNFSNLGSMHNVLTMQVSISCYSINNHGLIEKWVLQVHISEFINMGQIPKSQSVQIQNPIKLPFQMWIWCGLLSQPYFERV
jgi:hypothetical protein